MNLSLYSLLLIPRNARAHRIVTAKKNLARPKLCNFKFAHAITTVTDDAIRTNVLNVPIGMLSKPCGHAVLPTRRSTYDENSAPKSMTSEARNSQMPTFALYNPVSRRGSIVYGISMRFPEIDF